MVFYVQDHPTHQEAQMALVTLRLTPEQARWLDDLFEKQRSDAHWSRERVSPEQARYKTDVGRELTDAMRSAGVKTSRHSVGQCDS